MSEEPGTPPWTEAPAGDAGDVPERVGARSPGDGAATDTPAATADPPAARIRATNGLLVLSDFDGTLADVRPRPDQARIRPDARAALASLADLPKIAVAVVSGRALSDVRERVGLDGVAYAGNHGLEIETPERRFVHPEAEAVTPVVEAVCADLRDRLADVEGTIVEEKSLSATVHYRRVAAADVDRVGTAVRAAVAEHAGGEDRPALRVDEGKQIFELKPDVDWDKGRAVEWLRDVLAPDGESWHPVYVGDDVTDEDAFRALAGTGTAVRVGGPGEPTAAGYRLDGPGDVPALFEWLEAVRRGDDRPS